MTIEDINNTPNSTLLLVGGVQEDYSPFALLFDYITDETDTVQADITDNYVETNYSIQDHIAIKPRIYRLRGCVGEVLHVNNYQVERMFEEYSQNHPVFKKTMDSINAISSLSGIVSNYTRAAMNVAKQVESSINRYLDIWKNFTGQNETIRGKRQNIVADKLRSLLLNRQPVKLKGLAFNYIYGKQNYDSLFFIQSVSAHQGDNAYISDIEVVVKEFRIATTKTTKIDKNKYGGLVATQKTSEANNGNSQGNEIPVEEKNEIVESLIKNDKIKDFYYKYQNFMLKNFPSINNFSAILNNK